MLYSTKQKQKTNKNHMESSIKMSVQMNKKVSVADFSMICSVVYDIILLEQWCGIHLQKASEIRLLVLQKQEGLSLLYLYKAKIPFPDA
jgi:hypothetical protein